MCEDVPFIPVRAVSVKMCEDVPFIPVRAVSVKMCEDVPFIPVRAVSVKMCEDVPFIPVVYNVDTERLLHVATGDRWLIQTLLLTLAGHIMFIK